MKKILLLTALFLLPKFGFSQDLPPDTNPSLQPVGASSSTFGSTAYQGGLWNISNSTFGAQQSGIWNVGLNTGTNNIGTVSGSTVTTLQGTNPWVVSSSSAAALTTSYQGGSWNVNVTTGSVTAFQTNPDNFQEETNALVSSTPVVYVNGSTEPLNMSQYGYLKTQQELSADPYYSIGSTVTLVATPTDIMTIGANNTKVIRVTKIELFTTQAAVNYGTFYIVKRSSGDTGGAPRESIPVSFDSSNPASSAIINIYTSNPTVASSLGTVAIDKILEPANTAPTLPCFFTIDFTNAGLSQGIVLRRYQSLAINFNGATLGATSEFQANIYWDELSN